MRLYYMTKLDTATRFILPERRMRISQFHRLNDPFELMGVKMDGPRARKIYKALIDHWSTSIGIICMVKHWQSPLMWAHYADSHHGVCLGFDVPDEMPRKMNYEPERIKYLIDPTKTIGGITRELLLQVLTTKFTQWSYEEEWRLFSDFKEPDPTNGEFYLPFSKDLALKEIIVGARCKSSVGSFKKLLSRVDHSVRIIKARPAFETFTIVRQKQVSAINVHPKR
jgi:hypothetical protein